MLSELDFYKMHQIGKLTAHSEKLRLLGFHLVQNIEAFDTAKSPGLLDFTKLDLSIGWSVFADYGKRLHCAAKVEPVPVSYGDAVYAVDDFLTDTYHVNGSAVVPCIVRDRLIGRSNRGDFDVFKVGLPCVMVRPILTTEGPASPYRNPV